MGDEIAKANEVRVECILRGIWHARIGPRKGGLSFVSDSPRHAVDGLMQLCERFDWSWDESWHEPLY